MKAHQTTQLRSILVLFFFLGLSLPLAAQENSNTIPSITVSAEIDLTQTAPRIEDFLYGMFMENLGNDEVSNIVDDGLLAELLDDRKFFYPVDNDPELDPINLRRTMRQWKPVGPEEFVRMNRIRAFVGKQSPEITLDAQTPRGIQQEGFAIEAGEYTGRIVMAGSPEAEVRVRLVWGEGPDDYQETMITSLDDSYQPFPFEFTYEGEKSTGRLEIAAIGTGSVLIGAVSLMPADNIEGFRTDTIELLKNLNSGIYRWGGNFLSGYNWRDGIGDIDHRPPRYDYAWEGLENNDFGTFEFLALCRLVGVEPYMTVNAGLGDAYSAGQWVEYVNGSTDTPLGKLRAEHGHPEPFHVRWWNIGNEMYGWWQLGHMALNQYVIKHNMFAEQMLAVDSTIQLVATGADLSEMTITENSLRITGKVQAEPGSAADWTGGLLEHSLEYIDAIAEHYYMQVEQRFSLEEGKYVDVQEPLPIWALKAANRVQLKVENYEKYAQRFPEFEKRDIPIWMDEWSFGDRWVHTKPELRITLAYAKAFHEMFRHTNLFKMAGFTFATTCLSFNGTDAIYNTNGLLFKLYRDHYGTIPVEVSGTAPPPPPNRPVGGDQPTQNAGSDTWPLDVAAALNEAGTELTVSIVNPTENHQSISLEFDRTLDQQSITHWQITGPGPNSRNLVGQELEVQLRERNLDPVGRPLEIEPLSINIYQYRLTAP